MTVLANIQARIKADSRNVIHQGINIEASRNTYTDFSSGKAGIESVAAAMSSDIRNAIGSGELAAREMIQLGYILTDIVGDADLAGEYLRPVFAVSGASGDPWRGGPRPAMAGVTQGDLFRPINHGNIQPRDSGDAGKIGVEAEDGNGTGNVIEIKLKYKDGWTSEQKAEADAKIKALLNVKLVKTKPVRNGTSASARYKSIYGQNSIPTGYDIDHILDLQLGGADDILNMNPLDRSVNRSLGSQIKNAIKQYDYGTVFKFIISD